jgi:hypothetical protein
MCLRISIRSPSARAKRRDNRDQQAGDEECGPDVHANNVRKARIAARALRRTANALAE